MNWMNLHVHCRGLNLRQDKATNLHKNHSEMF